MSVCFFVPAAEQTVNVGEEGIEQEAVEEVPTPDSAQQTLQQFWQNVMEDIKKVTSEDFKTQALPLARIKKIMKLDEEVKMISAEAPILFAKAAEIFIHELTLRAWSHTEDNKRRTLQRNDIAMAISKSDQFDFLIDIVPRHEVKPTKMRDDPPRPMHTVEQLPQHHQRNDIAMAISKSDQFDFLIDIVPRHEVKPTKMRDDPPRPMHTVEQLPQHHQTLQQHQFIIQPTQIVQPSGSSTAQAATTSSNVAVSQQPVIVQQLVTSNGEVQQIPQLQLTQAQLNMIRLQLQNNQQGSPLVIHAHQQTPQIIQVTSQAQHQPQQQVFIAQVSNQDDS